MKMRPRALWGQIRFIPRISFMISSIVIKDIWRSRFLIFRFSVNLKDCSPSYSNSQRAPYSLRDNRISPFIKILRRISVCSCVSTRGSLWARDSFSFSAIIRMRSLPAGAERIFSVTNVCFQLNCSCTLAWVRLLHCSPLLCELDAYRLLKIAFIVSSLCPCGAS